MVNELFNPRCVSDMGNTTTDVIQRFYREWR